MWSEVPSASNPSGSNLRMTTHHAPKTSPPVPMTLEGQRTRENKTTGKKKKQTDKTTG